MNKNNFTKIVTFCIFAFLITLNSCKDDEVDATPSPNLQTTGSINDFGEVTIATISATQVIQIKGLRLNQ